MDKIFINDMEFYGYHGVLPEENRLGQRFRITLTLELNLEKAGSSDDLNDTVSYADVYNSVKEIVEGDPYHLLEALAEKITSTILGDYPLVQSVIVKVIKPDPPIPGHYHSVAVEIVRGRSNG